jgi:predicted AAA+ superfamily ATPase
MQKRIFVQIENHPYNMHEYIHRHVENFLIENLKVFPAVVLLGPRQCGKSTLVKKTAETISSTVYLDLQRIDDLNKLNEPTLFFEANEDKMICLDEIQLMPTLFSVLRSVIDNNRQNGHFILLGSASRQLVQQTSESLAGRIGIIELSPFIISELYNNSAFDLKKFWFRGGYPDSYLAITDSASVLWCTNFILTYVERDIPQLGFQIPALQIRRLLIMCAHSQGQLFNASKLGESLGLTHPTIKRYLDLLEQTFIIRSLPPFEANIKKRLVKTPKVYIRDTGILHRLLQINDFNTLMGHPIFGASWEGFVIENICTYFRECEFFFYRSSAGNELDLIIKKFDSIIAVECKASTAPQLTKGFWKAVEDIQPTKTFVVAPISGYYLYKNDVIISGLKEALGLIEIALQ